MSSHIWKYKDLYEMSDKVDNGVSLTSVEEGYLGFVSDPGEFCPTPKLIEFMKRSNEKGEYFRTRISADPTIKAENKRWILVKILKPL